MKDFCARNDLPTFIGEFGVAPSKGAASRARWLEAVADAAVDQNQ